MQERLAAGLAMIAGYVDAYGFIRYRTYVSFMSGNTTQTGSLTGQGDLVAAMPALLAIVFLVIGAFTGTFLAHSGARQLRWLSFGLVATLLAVIIGVTQLGSSASGVGIATLSLAMGFMNTALSRVGAQSVNLVFVTGTLNTMAQHLALAVKRAPLPEAQGAWDTHGRRAFLLHGRMGLLPDRCAFGGSSDIALRRVGFAAPCLDTAGISSVQPCSEHQCELQCVKDTHATGG